MSKFQENKHTPGQNYTTGSLLKKEQNFEIKQGFFIVMIVHELPKIDRNEETMKIIFKCL